MKAEFRFPDGRPRLDLSVYETSAAQQIQASIEHAVAFQKPQPALFSLDLDHVQDGEGAPAVDPAPGKPCEFRFIQQQHRNIMFLSDDAVVRFAERLLPVAAARELKLSLEAQVRYVCERLVAGDLEWTTALDAKETWASWVRKRAKQHNFPIPLAFGGS
jgi:hypothetical protein